MKALFRSALLFLALAGWSACNRPDVQAIPPAAVVQPEAGGTGRFLPGQEKIVQRHIDVINSLIRTHQTDNVKDARAAFDLRSGLITITAGGDRRADAVAFCNTVAGEYVRTSNLTARILQLAQ